MIGSGSIGASDLNLKRSLVTVAHYGSGDEGMPVCYISQSVWKVCLSMLPF